MRYDQVNAILLNEFLKEHCIVEEQLASIAELKSTLVWQKKEFELTAAQQQMEIQTLTAAVKEQASQVQKVTAQLDLGRMRPRVDRNVRSEKMIE